MAWVPFPLIPQPAGEPQRAAPAVGSWVRVPWPAVPPPGEEQALFEAQVIDVYQAAEWDEDVRGPVPPEEIWVRLLYPPQCGYNEDTEVSMQRAAPCRRQLRGAVAGSLWHDLGVQNGHEPAVLGPEEQGCIFIIVSCLLQDTTWDHCFNNPASTVLYMPPGALEQLCPGFRPGPQPPLPARTGGGSREQQGVQKPPASQKGKAKTKAKGKRKLAQALRDGEETSHWSMEGLSKETHSTAGKKPNLQGPPPGWSPDEAGPSHWAGAPPQPSSDSDITAAAAQRLPGVRATQGTQGLQRAPVTMAELSSDDDDDFQAPTQRALARHPAKQPRLHPAADYSVGPLPACAVAACLCCCCLLVLLPR